MENWKFNRVQSISFLFVQQVDTAEISICVLEKLTRTTRHIATNEKDFQVDFDWNNAVLAALKLKIQQRKLKTV